MWSRVVLDAVGYELPSEVVATRELEQRLDTLYRKFRIPMGQVEVMTGIRERRFWPRGVSLSEMAALAAQDALARCHVPVSAIDTLIYASVCREAFEPATACMVAGHLAKQGLELPAHVELFDLSNACLGALNAMRVLADQIEQGRIRAGMVVVCESAREIVEITTQKLLREAGLDSFKYGLATLTGGSAAAAIVMSDGRYSPYTEKHLVRGAVCRTDYRQHELCRWGVRPASLDQNESSIPGLREEYMMTDSVGVLEHGVALGQQTWSAFLDAMQWDVESIDETICHQVGRAHRERVLGIIGVSPERDFTTFETLGNTGSVALPLTLALADERGELNVGDRVALLGIGSGLNCLMLGVQW